MFSADSDVQPSESERGEVLLTPELAFEQAVVSKFSPDPIEPLLDVRKAAQLLGISPKTLRDWIQARKIEYVKVGTRVMFRPASIRQFVAANTRPAAK